MQSRYPLRITTQSGTLSSTFKMTSLLIFLWCGLGWSCSEDLNSLNQYTGDYKSQGIQSGDQCASGCVWSAYAVNIGVQNAEVYCGNQKCACVVDQDVYSSCEAQNQSSPSSGPEMSRAKAGETCFSGCIWSTYAVRSGAQRSQADCDGADCACVVDGNIYELCSSSSDPSPPAPSPLTPTLITFEQTKQVSIGITEATDLSPKIRAFLDMLAAAEGTSIMNNPCGKADYGYASLFECYRYSSRRFYSYADHPRQSFSTGWGSYTDASGRYQFQAATWDEVADQDGLSDFSPANQDRAAVNRIKARGAYHLISQVQIGRTPDSAFKRAVDECACEWASLPALYGSRNHHRTVSGMPSCYGQVTHRIEDLYDVFVAAYTTYAR